MDNIRGFD